MSTVLLIGEDELLLQTRAAVLRTIGAETLCCDVSSALTLMEDRQCELVVLCHSLPIHLCETIAEIIHARWPKTRLLLVTATPGWEQTDLPGLMDAVSSADPDRLVGRTVELLGRRGPTPASLGSPCRPIRANSPRQ
jgi:DNA-binding response OmpR family regulator